MLAIPTLGPQVLAEIEVERSLPLACSLATELIALGILKESDWDHALATTISNAFNRWINRDLGAGQWLNLGLSLGYSDDLSRAWDMNFFEGNLLDLEGLQFDEELPYGAFFLTAHLDDGLYGATVGRAIKRIEKRWPEVGYSVLSLLSCALQNSIGAVTPVTAKDRLEDWDEIRSDEEEEDDGLITRKVFFEQIPRAACSFHWWRTKIHIAAAVTKNPTLVSAGRLAKLVYHLTPHNYAYRLEDAESYVPVLLRWNDQDCLPQFFDDINEMIGQTNPTDVVWLYPFQLTPIGATGLSQAVDALRRVVLILGECDRLMSLLIDEANSAH